MDRDAYFALRWSEDFRGGDSDMFCVDGNGLFLSSGDEGSPGKMIRFAEEAAGCLMDRGDGGLIEEVFVDAGDSEVVAEVALHIFTVDPIEMTAGDDSGCQRLRVAVEELIDEVVLSGQDERQVGLGVLVKLANGV